MLIIILVLFDLKFKFIPKPINNNNLRLFYCRVQDTPKAKYKWRIDLSKTECHWPGWFKGLSSLFLNCSVPKLLILAGIDTLDRELTVGQMQGKFQMQVLPQCGHAVHEDVPEKVAEILASFMVRFKFAESTSDFHRYASFYSLNPSPPPSPSQLFKKLINF